MQADPGGRVIEQFHHPQRLQLGRGVVTAAWPIEDVALVGGLALDVAGLAGNAGDAFPAAMERLELVVGDAPILQLHLAVIGAGQAVALDGPAADLEVPRAEAPRHASPVETSTTDATAHFEDAKSRSSAATWSGLLRKLTVSSRGGENSHFRRLQRSSSGSTAGGVWVEVFPQGLRSMATTFGPARVSSSAINEPDQPRPTMTTSAFERLFTMMFSSAGKRLAAAARRSVAEQR